MYIIDNVSIEMCLSGSVKVYHLEVVIFIFPSGPSFKMSF